MKNEQINNESVIKNDAEKGENLFSILQQVAFLIIGMLSWTAWPYCFDIPQGVQTQLKQQPYFMTVSEFNGLYVASSLPNAVLNFLSAWITLKIGITKAIVMYSIILLGGQTIIFMSTYKLFDGWYALLIVGRFLIGFSGYAMTSANLSLIPKFTNKNLVALFVGIGSMVPWTTEALSDLLSPIIYEKTGKVYSAFFGGWIISLISFIFALILFFYCKHLNKRKPIQCQQKSSNFKLKDIKKLGIIMLIIFFVLFFAVSIQGSIIVNANDMLHERVGFSNTEAGTIAMMTLLINGPVTPIWAFVKQKIVKKRRLFVIIGIVLFLDILILYLLPDHISPLSYAMAYIGFILLGVWDSGAVTVIIGSFPTILDESILPLGFSIYTSGLALAMGLSPIITAAVISASPNYKEGYKNTYYLYFAYFAITFAGLLYLWLSNNPQANKIEQADKQTKLSLLVQQQT